MDVMQAMSREKADRISSSNVKARMRPSIALQREEREQLRTVYDQAWEQFSLATTACEALMKDAAPHSEGVAAAQAALRSAEIRYWQARNALTDFLLRKARQERLARSA